MIIKKFTASTEKEAIILAQNELGKDAIVMMGTQRYRKALKADEFVFNYVCQHGEQPIKVTY